MEITADAVELLKKRIEFIFGRTVAHHQDCKDLAEKIYLTTGKLLGLQTIKRFFKLISPSGKPSPFTLNTLADYAGCPDFYAFMRSQNSSPVYSFSNQLSQRDTIRNFYGIELVDIWTTYWKACMQMAITTVQEAEKDPELFVELAGCPPSQITFYEWFPNYDGLGGNYRLGLETYRHYKKSTEAQLFSNGLLFLSALLTQNAELIHQIHQKMDPLQINDSIHPMPVGRYMASQFVYHSSNKHGAQIERWENAFWLLLLEKSGNYSVLPNVQFSIIEILLIAGFDETAFKVYQKYPLLVKTEYQNSEHSSWQLIVQMEYENAAKVLMAWMYYKNGYINESRFWFKEIIPAQFHYFHSKFYSLLYELLHLRLISSSAEGKKQRCHKRILNLIKETGFSLFQNWIV